MKFQVSNIKFRFSNTMKFLDIVTDNFSMKCDITHYHRALISQFCGCDKWNALLPSLLDAASIIRVNELLFAGSSKSSSSMVNSTNLTLITRNLPNGWFKPISSLLVLMLLVFWRQPGIWPIHLVLKSCSPIVLGTA